MTDLFRTVQTSTETVPVRIEFDGGSTCNIPRLGFGRGYGSYKLNSSKPVKVQFEDGLSANAAEVRTLVEGIKAAKKLRATKVLIVGDSRIALSWADTCAGNRERKLSQSSTIEFREAIRLLAVELEGIEVKTQWQPRLKSVATFGH